MIYKPDGAGPFPAVVAMHDCSGLTNAGDRITSKYRE
jgi:dienelactone hydrolase